MNTQSGERTSALRHEASGLAALVALSFAGAVIELWAFLLSHGVAP